MLPEVAEITVNLKMVESILQLIRSLPQPERNILNQRLAEEIPDLTTKELMQLAEKGGAFDFLHDEPDLYTTEDGEPVEWH
jgi:hypothetical protein